MLNHRSVRPAYAGRSRKRSQHCSPLSLLAGCATTTVPEYRPRLPWRPIGYSDLQLSPNRYRVSFSGSTASTRDDVERYLLRRAAEVTLQTGYTHFVLSNRDTERDTNFYGNDFSTGPYYSYYPYRSLYWDYSVLGCRRLVERTAIQLTRTS